MKRASYREAVAWIGHNDSAGCDDALDPSEVGYLVSSVLIADIFDITPEKVGEDVVRYRKNKMDLSEDGL